MNIEKSSGWHMQDETERVAWDASYKTSQSLGLWNGPPVPFLANAIELFKREEADHVLEVPCGDGRNTIALCESFSQVTGLDSSPEALKMLTSKIASHNQSNCRLFCGDVVNMPFNSGVFDGVFCCDLLGHLREPSSAILELLRVCKPGSYVIANVFSVGDSTRGKEMQSLGNEQYMYQNRFFFKFYTREEVISLIASIRCTLVGLDIAHWTEPPHQCYREYEHEHESWVMTLKL